MSCQVQINTINQLKSKNIIDDFSFDGLNRILDRAEFDKLNEKYTAFAKAKYPNLVVPDGELLFSINVVENEDWSRSTYRRDAKYRTYWAVPNKDLFAKLQVEFDKVQQKLNEPDQQDYLLSRPLTGTVSSLEFLYFQLNKNESPDLETQGIPLVDINIETLQDARSKRVAEELAKKLSLGLNIGFQNITPEKASEITRVSPTPYNGEPAFYYAGTVYVVGDNVSVNTVLHEFSHPVIN